MTVLPQLKRDLLEAAHDVLADRDDNREHRAAGRHVSSRLGRLWTAAPVLAGALIALVIAVVGLLAFKHGSSSTDAGARQAAALQRLKSTLGVLRQPQTDADRLFRSMVLPLPRNTAGSDIEPLWGDVRLATITKWGAKVFLVPLRPRNPVVARRHPVALATWVQGIGWDDFSFPSDVAGGNDWGPGGVARLQDGEAVFRFFEVVPDGVARVVFYDAAFRAPLGPPSIVGHQTAIVHDNVAVFQRRGAEASTVLAAWYAADGRLIKRIGDFGNAAPTIRGRQQLIHLLAILRRPQTYADLHSHTIAGILRRPGGFGFGQRPVDTPLVRLAGMTPWRDPVYLIPYKPATTTGPGPQPASASSPIEGIWLESGGGSCCYTATDIESGQALNEGGFTPVAGSPKVRLIMLVPDGVARVEFRFRSPSMSRTVPVHNNIAAAQFPRPFSPACCKGLERTVWYAADGHTVPQRGP